MNLRLANPATSEGRAPVRRSPGGDRSSGTPRDARAATDRAAVAGRLRPRPVAPGIAGPESGCPIGRQLDTQAHRGPDGPARRRMPSRRGPGLRRLRALAETKVARSL